MFKPKIIFKCSKCHILIGVQDLTEQHDYKITSTLSDTIRKATQSMLCLECSPFPIKKIHQCKWKECPKMDMDGPLDDVILCMAHNLLFAQMAHGSLDNLKLATNNILVDYIEVPDDYNVSN